MRTSNPRPVVRVLLTIVVLGWMGVIFYFSSQPATNSDELSKGLAKAITEGIEKITNKPVESDLAHWNRVLRKNAHFFAYLILSILLMAGLRVFHVRLKRSVWIAFGLSVLYAISDELHQLFVSGRGAQLRDVLIDSSGAALGIILFGKTE